MQCPRCPDVFRQKAGMVTHLRSVHMGLRDFKCPLCPADFGQLATKNRHVRTVHEKRKDYPCPQCSKAFGESYSSEPRRYLTIAGKDMPTLVKYMLGSLDFLRGSIRPAMTIYLVILTTFMYWKMVDLSAGIEFDPTQAWEVVQLIVSTMLYLTSTAVLWWFGTRNKRNPPSGS